MPPVRPAAALAALLALAAAGCGADPSTVAGTVTYQGKPVAGGSVIVYCPDGQIARGTIGPDGSYAIPNVPAGAAAVTVQSYARLPNGLRLRQTLPPSSGGPTPPVETGEPGPAPIPPRYALPEESGLSVVVDRARVTYDIDLKP
jgi:hypothetical protein